MANPPRVKGTRAESAVVKWLNDELGTNVTRSPLRGNKDCGDIIGLPDTVLEIKNTKVPSPKAWADELRAEMRNAKARNGVILWSPPGVGMNSVDRWVAFEPWDYSSARTVPQFGTLGQLHKYVAVMDECGYRVGIDGTTLVASSAGTWLDGWRECNLHKLAASALSAESQALGLYDDGAA